MPTCTNCDSFVTDRFVRVFGDDGRVTACLNCETARALREGSGIPPESIPN